MPDRRFAITLALAASLAAHVAPPAHAQAVWRVAALEDVHTRVEVPGRFRVSSRSAVNEQGFVIHHRIAEHVSPEGVFALIVLEQEGGCVSSPPHVADVFSERLLRPYPGVEIRGRRRLPRPGFYADELALEGDDALGRLRRVVGRGRVYLALTLVPSDGLARARRFVGSLRPDPSDALFEVARAASPTWTVVDVPHERFSVRMPTPFADRLMRLRLADGTTLTARFVEGRDGDVTYRVRSIDRGDAPNLSAGRIVERLGLEGEARPLQSHGHPGLELRGPGRRVRLYRLRDRFLVFEVEVVDDGVGVEGALDAFFDSVVLS